MEVHLDMILYRIYLLNNKTFVPFILVLNVSLRSIERTPLKITLRRFTPRPPHSAKVFLL